MKNTFFLIVEVTFQLLHGEVELEKSDLRSYRLYDKRRLNSCYQEYLIVPHGIGACYRREYNW